MKLNKIYLTKHSNIAGIVITLRQEGFAATTETEDQSNVIFTNATLSQAVLCFGNSSWVDLSKTNLPVS